jgi:translation initiation factor 3 subunit H
MEKAECCQIALNFADTQVFLKMLKHSTDILPQPQGASYTDRASPPTTNLSSHVDSLGVLLGLDLDGVLEIEDSFALPVNESAVGGMNIHNLRRI